MEGWSLEDVLWCAWCDINLRAQDLTEHMPHYRNPDEWPFAPNEGDVYKCRDCGKFTLVDAQGMVCELPMKLKRRKTNGTSN